MRPGAIANSVVGNFKNGTESLWPGQPYQLGRQPLVKDRVHALGRDVQAGLVREDQGRVQVVIDRDVDLAAAATEAR